MIEPNPPKKTLLFILFSTFLTSFAFFSVQSFFLIVLLFITVNAFRTSATPLTDNISILYAKKHNKNYGMIRVWGDIGIGTSSLLLGIVIGITGVHHLGWMYASILLLSIPVAFSLIDSRPKNHTQVSFGSLQKLIINRKFIGFVCLCLIIIVAHRMNDSLFTLYLSESGASETLIGNAWMIATFSSIPAFIITGQLVKRYDELYLVLLAASLYSLRWFLYSLIEDPVMLTYMQFTQGITFPIFSVAALMLITKLVPEELVATGQMIYTAIISGVGGMIGSAGGGWLMGTYSPKITYQIGSLLCLIGAILCFVFIKLNREKDMTYSYSKEI